MRGRTGLALLFAGLILATLAVYQPAWHGGRIWDDDAHLTSQRLQSMDGLRRIWVEPGATQQYYPMAHSAFWVMHRVFGDDTLGYHLVNILLHALSACLFAVILRRLGVPWWWFAAAAFALHPVHVESVAWMSELKNTLSGACYLGAALAYLAFDARRRSAVYALSLLLFVVALLTKTVTATLPAALLVVFWWQRGRIDWRRDVRPLVPFFVIGVAAGVMTAWVEHVYVGARGAPFALSFLDRGLVAGRAIWFYVSKLFWPANLIFTYPRWHIDPSEWAQFLWPLAAIAATVALWRVRTRTRAPLAAWLFFGGTLAPALGFINVFPFRYSFVADHFQYLASLGLIALASAGLAGLVKRAGPRERVAAVATALIVLLPLGGATWRQSHEYADANTLYRATIAKNPDCWLAYNNLGVSKLGVSIADAIANFTRALELNPEFFEAHNNLAYAYLQLQLYDDAAHEAREALRFQPDYAEALVSLGSAMSGLGKYQEAATAYERALELRPGLAEAHLNLGNILMTLGEHDEGVIQLQMAAALKPTLPDAHLCLGEALVKVGRLTEAIASFKEALRLRPEYPEARDGLAKAEAKLKGGR